MKRILIVDDEPAVAEVVAKVARGCGYAVTVTTDAEEFVDRLIAVDPDVIVLDLSMPGTDGVELLRYLGTAKCRARILIMSGFDPRVLETTGKMGAALGLTIAGTLYKPARVADLRAAFAALERTVLL